jgi:ElaB/YqjD/DUF883 family membrane-anchored ribosome-binding protein
MHATSLTFQMPSAAMTDMSMPQSTPVSHREPDMREGTESKREAIANAIDDAADRLHDTASSGRGKIAGLADRTANALDSTGRWVREMETRDVVGEVTAMAKRHPGASLVAAAAIGFLLGRSFTRTSS